MANGTPLQQFNTPNLSMRHLDETLSTDAVPEHTFDRVERLQPEDIVAVEIDLFPIGLVFHPGEQLRLVISARNPLGGIFPGNDFYDGQPNGRLIVHTGGSQESYLNLPVMAS